MGCARAIEGGQTFAQWRKALLADPQALSVATLPRHRLDNIFRTNTQAAYLRGITRQQESPNALKRRPFFQYDAINDSRTRPAHAAMDNYIAPADDPVWKRWTPPSGYRCRCIRLAITEAEARARGWSGSPKPVPSEPDAGFAGHPLDWDQKLTDLYTEKLNKAHPAIGAAQAKAFAVPKTVDEFINAGRAITATLPDGLNSPAECHKALLDLLEKEVGISTPCKVASGGAGSKLVQAASQRYPNAWTETADALGQLFVKAGAKTRGFAYTETRSWEKTGGYLRLELFGAMHNVKAGTGFIAVRTGAMGNAVHEFAHRLQKALPTLDGLFQQLHTERVAGNPVKRIRDLKPLSGYGATELTREDHYTNPYQGKEYEIRRVNGTLEAALGGALEVMTMAFESVLGLVPGSEKSVQAFAYMYRDDRKMFDFTVGLLRHWKP